MAEPPGGAPLAGVSLSGHAGWVRALASGGRWLFSAGGGALSQRVLSVLRFQLVLPVLSHRDLPQLRPLHLTLIYQEDLQSTGLLILLCMPPLEHALPPAWQ